MDGMILHQPEENSSKVNSVLTAVGGLMDRVRRGVEYQVENGWKIVNPGSFLAVAAAVGAVALLTSVYTGGYVVSVDGVSLGAVASREEFQQCVDEVEERASDILGYDYHLNQDVSFKPALVARNEVGPATRFEPYLLDHVDAVAERYVLRVDGEMVGAAASAGQLTALLDEIKDDYVNENTTDFDFLADVNIDQEYVPVDVTQDMTAMRSMLTSNTNGETVYEVEKGDTFMQIAIDNHMTMREMENLNPGVDINKLMIGQELNVREEVPFLSVRTVDRLTYEESIARPVEEVKDSSMFKGEKKVLKDGTDGKSMVTADVTYVNGHEKSRSVVESHVVAQPTAKVVAVGTKERPTWLPHGYFVWPLHGTITSHYGYRSIFGSYNFHGGVDIAAPYGSNIVAADGGTVKFAGTASGYNWSYGNLVIIDHGNGKETYYGHCSSVNVSAGQHVYQGQSIARVGSTGRSSGNHCHFEVRVNGSRVNPMNYL